MNGMKVCPLSLAPTVVRLFIQKDPQIALTVEQMPTSGMKKIMIVMSAKIVEPISLLRKAGPQFVLTVATNKNK